MTSDVLTELKAIRKDLSYIKKHMVDADSLLSPKEAMQLRESLAEYKEGKTIRLAEFRR